MIKFTPQRVLAVIAAAWGFGVLVGGPHRFNGSSFEVLRGYAPWWFWGVFLLAYAVILVVAENWKYYWAVVLFGGVPYAFVVVGYWNGVFATQSLSMVGASVYTGIWMIYVGFGTSLAMEGFSQTEWYRERVGKL